MTKRLLIAGMAMAMSLGLPPAINAKMATGFLTGSNDALSPGLYNLQLEGEPTIEQVKPLMYTLFGGAYAERNYWVILADDVAGNMMEGLWGISLPEAEVVKRNLDVTYGCTDMTFDYSSGELYGVYSMNLGSAKPHQLIRISTYDGSYENVGPLYDSFMALACDLWGRMVGMSAQGRLYEINSSDGSKTLIGETDIVTAADQVQSMEFDRDNGRLYWTFHDTDDNSWLAELNPETGEVVKKSKVQSNALLGGLYVPFTELTAMSPNQVTGLEYASTPDGIRFIWRAPLITRDGTTLTGPMDVQIRRGGKLVHTLTGINPGDECQWTDGTELPDGDTRYAFTCYQGSLRGSSLFTSVHIGESVPNAVTDLSACSDGDGIRLDWKAPDSDRYGGHLDASKLSYRITRFPDGKMTDGITATSYSDNDLGEANQWSYEVVPVNHKGDGEPSRTNAVIAGPAITPPWYPDFADQAQRLQFLTVDANGDGNTWTSRDGEMSFSCMYGDGDDWLITMPIRMEQGKEYKMSCRIRTGGTWSPEDFRITLGTGLTPEGQNVQVLYDETGITSADETIVKTITVAQTGDYTVGLYCHTGKWMGMMLNIASFQIEPVGAVDLAINDKLKGELLPSLGQTYRYTANVYNNGQEAQSGFAVSLLDNADNLLDKVECDAAVAPGESIPVELSWTPMDGRVKSLRAVVEKEGDVNSRNNVSKPFEVIFLNEGDAIARFDEHDSDPAVAPFSFLDIYSFAESVYSADELGIDGGMVNEISWTYNNPADDMADRDIKVFMANVGGDAIVAEYIPESRMQLVYEGKASFLHGENSLDLKLTAPFAYSGGNLAILAYKLGGNEKELRVTFHAKDFPGIPRTAISYNSSGVIEPESFLASSMLPCVTLRLNTDGGQKLTGNVSSEGRPVDGVTVALNGKSTSAVTDRRGNYEFKWIPAGDYAVDFTTGSYAYLDATGSVSVSEGSDAVLDQILPVRPSAPLKGVVADVQGNPVAGAAVVFTGWETRTATSDADGAFEFPKLYQHDEADVKVYATGYKRAGKTFAYTASESFALDIDLQAIHNPVTEGSVSLRDKFPVIAWKPVNFDYEIAEDNGVAAGVITIDTYGSYMLAKRFAGPLRISKVKWHSGQGMASPIETVDVYVYELNEAGRPQILVSLEGVPNEENAWNECRFDYELEAPYGAMVAIAGVAEASISSAGGYAPGSYIVDPDSGIYAPLAGDSGDVNLMIRLDASHFNPETGYEEPDVSYNVYRVSENTSEATLLKSGLRTETTFRDDAWTSIDEGWYKYAVEAVYPDGFKAEGYCTGALENRRSGMGFADASTGVAGGKGCIRIRGLYGHRVRVVNAAGLTVAELTVPSDDHTVDVQAGVHTVVVGPNACKLFVK